MKKSSKVLEKKGGAIPQPPAKAPSREDQAATQHVERYSHAAIHRYHDTPMKKTYRQLEQDWQPVFKGQTPPDFPMMRELIRQHDTTEFQDDRRVFPLPEVAPTGKGYMHDDRETSHFVRETLHRINPLLSTAYLDAHGINDDAERHYHNTDFQYGHHGYSRARDHKAKQHAQFGIRPRTGVQRGPRPELIMVGGGYPRRQKYY